MKNTGQQTRGDKMTNTTKTQTITIGKNATSAPERYEVFFTANGRDRSMMVMATSEANAIEIVRASYPTMTNVEVELVSGN